MVRTVKLASLRRHAVQIASQKQSRRWLWRVPILIFGMIVRGFAIFVASMVLLILTLRFVDPPVTPYMLAEMLRLDRVEQISVSMRDLPRDVPLSIVAAEDSDFCAHRGIDFEAVRAAWEGGAERGGSTISQQLAKNLFLWQGRSWLRKGLEAGLTLGIEVLWPKRRILEVYLNVAEFGEGIFGIEAAAWHYYRKPASELRQREAARLAVILPLPKERDPNNLSATLNRRAAQVATGGRVLLAEGRADCFLDQP